MNPHDASCPRGRWLLRRRDEEGWTGLFWVVLFREGPPCECSQDVDCSAAEQSAARDG